MVFGGTRQIFITDQPVAFDRLIRVLDVFNTTFGIFNSVLRTILYNFFEHAMFDTKHTIYICFITTP